MANASIFSQYTRPVRSMQEYSQDYDAAEQNKLALAAKRMQMQQAQSGMEDQQRIRGLASQYGGDENALIKALRGGGFFEQAGGIEKQIFERLKGQQDRDKTAVEVDEKRFKVAKERRDAYEAARSGFERDPALSKDKVLKVLEEMGSYGMLPGELVQKLTANLPDDPEQLRNDIRNGNLSRLTPEQMVTLFAPKYEYQDSGQQRIPVQMNMNAPGAVAPQTIQRVQTPDNVASQATALAGQQNTAQIAAANRGVQIRGQNLTDARSREATALGAAPAKPMTELQISKRRDQIAKDYTAAQTTLTNMDDVKKSAASVLSAPGLDRATGVAAYLPSYPGGKAAAAEVALQNLEGKVTQLGKAAAAAGGAIGPMAVQEWKIVRDMIAAIDPKKGKKPLEEQVALVVAAAEGAAARLQDAYQKQYAPDFERFPEFEDLGVSKPPSPDTPAKPAGGGLSAQEQKELDELRARFGGRK